MHCVFCCAEYKELLLKTTKLFNAKPLEKLGSVGALKRTVDHIFTKADKTMKSSYAYPIYSKIWNMSYEWNKAFERYVSAFHRRWMDEMAQLNIQITHENELSYIDNWTTKSQKNDMSRGFWRISESVCRSSVDTISMIAKWYV